MVATSLLVGRDAELSALDGFLHSDGSPRLLLLAGEPGIGKTALWNAGIATAAESGVRCLRARTSEAETRLSFAGLADLLSGVDRETLAGLPAPQLRALEVALGRAEPTGAAPEPLTISTGFLGAVRTIARGGSLLIAVDDVQWLDRPSAEAIAFAARRLGEDPVRFLFSCRSGSRLDVERAFDVGDVEHLEIRGLSFGAINRLLSARLGSTLPRRALRNVFDTSQGNPLFALELGRALIERGVPEIGAELPLPHVIDDLFGARISGLPEPVQRVLLAVGLSAGLKRFELADAVDAVALDDAFALRLLVDDSGVVRPSHPLLAAAAVQHSAASERRDTHLALAGALSDETLRARHLALAAVAPDAELASTVAAAARLASDRGAAHDAVELAGHALRLTPSGAQEYSDRMLVFARSLLTAGEIERATELLAPRIGALPRGRTRAAAHLILAETADSDAHEEHLARAIAESVDDPPLHATALAKKAVSLAVARVEQIAAAEALARRALAVSRSVGPAVDPTVLAALAWARIMRGRPIGPRGNQETAPAGVSLFEATERPAAVRRTFRGEFGQARVAFCHLSVRADERGEARSAAAFHVQQLELELRVGDTVAATRLLDEWDHWTVVHDAASFRHRLEAMLGATQGFPDRAERAAAAVFDVTASDPLHNWDHLEANRAIGIAALFERHHDRARTLLSEIWAHTVREGVDEPGAFPVAPDLVEALVASGEVDQARDVTDRLERLAVSQRHPWGRVTARRCQAMVQLGGAGYSDAAATALSGAAAAYESLGAGFDQARSLLYLGRVQRRFKRRGEARRSLEAAGALFDRLSCDGWASQTRSELARVSGRRAAAEGQLTPSERRVAELAASGLSNKEIAAQLFVSVYTVEGHLKHAYAKLGTRSRSQLAVALRGVQ